MNPFYNKALIKLSLVLLALSISLVRLEHLCWVRTTAQTFFQYRLVVVVQRQHLAAHTTNLKHLIRYMWILVDERLHPIDETSKLQTYFGFDPFEVGILFSGPLLSLSGCGTARQFGLVFQ